MTPDGKELETALAAAAKPPAALRLVKALMKKPMSQSALSQMRDESGHFADRLRSPEAMEAFAAFFEKRKPDFSKFN